MRYERCPKCGSAALPALQTATTACPACGAILAKAAAHRISPAPPSPVAAATDGEAGFAGLLFHVPERVDRIAWIGRVAALTFFCAWTATILATVDVPAGEAGSRFLWAILTPFHEAGHALLFRWFGSFMTILGGTLGQHLMPLTLAGALLWKRRDPFGAALFVWLFGFSLILMGVYMYDAYDPKLMLLDGRTGEDSDGHDWQNLFGDLGLLRSARGIGRFFGAAGRCVMLASLAWAAWVVWLQRSRLPDPSFPDRDANA